MLFRSVSQHLRSLKAAGLIAGRAQGRNVFYRAEPEGLAPLVDWLGHYGVFWRERFAGLRTLLQLGGVKHDTASSVIASAAHVLVCVDHTEKGRKVVRVSEVRSGRAADGQVELKDLYVYDGGFRQA